MKKLLMMAGVMAALVFSSCKKDKDSGAGNGSGGSTKLLKKVTETANGTTTVYNLNFDGNKHLTFLGSIDNLETTNFTYDGEGNVIKVEVKEHNYYSTYTYTYNNGIPVSGSLKTVMKTAGEPDDIMEDDVLTYTVVNNQVTKIHQQMNLADVELDVNLTYHPSGNLAKAEISGDEVYSIDYTYGTKKTAFPTMSKFVLDLGLSLAFAGKNELITTVMDFPGTQFDQTVTNQYTYDANGYPLTSNDGQTQLTFEYQ
jgi:hypothetical protein